MLREHDVPARLAEQGDDEAPGPGVVLVAQGTLAHGLVLTEIQRDYEGDTRFPDWDRAPWRETQRKPQAAADGLRFDFVLYERRP